MAEYLKYLSGKPVFTSQSGSTLTSDMASEPIGQYEFNGSELSLKVNERFEGIIDEEPVRNALKKFKVSDTFGLVDLLENHTSAIEHLPLSDPHFNAGISMFLGRGICSIFNRNGANNPNVNANPDLIGTDDSLEITKLIKRGYQNSGNVKTTEFHVPVFTAFPISLSTIPNHPPVIKVSLETSSSYKQKASFKISLPGLSGGFSSNKSMTVVMSHPAHPEPIQLQQKMQCKTTKWVHKNSSSYSPISSYAFEQISGKRLTYDDGDPDNEFIDCKPTQTSRFEFEKISIVKNHHNPKIDYSLNLQETFSDTFTIDATTLGIPTLEVSTEIEDSFKVAYGLLPGFEYTFEGSRDDAHYLTPSARAL